MYLAIKIINSFGSSFSFLKDSRLLPGRISGLTVGAMRRLAPACFLFDINQLIIIFYFCAYWQKPFTVKGFVLIVYMGAQFYTGNNFSVTQFVYQISDFIISSILNP